MAAISRVYTIGLVAQILDEDEEFLEELAINMFPEDGRLYVNGCADESIVAFTEDGIENLRALVSDMKG